jgi:hypothetical protein
MKEKKTNKKKTLQVSGMVYYHKIYHGKKDYKYTYPKTKQIKVYAFLFLFIFFFWLILQ